MKIKARLIEEGDKAYVFKSWLKEWEKIEPVEESWDWNTRHKQIEDFMDSSLVVIACKPDDHNRILGFKAYRQGKLFFEYYRFKYRGKIEESFQNELRRIKNGD